MIGYDGRDITTGMFNHNSQAITSTTGGLADNLKSSGEYVAAYLKNDSVQTVTLGEVRIGKIPSKRRIAVTKKCPMYAKLLMSDSAVRGNLHENTEAECSLFTNSDEMTDNIFTLCGFIWKGAAQIEI